MFPADGAGLTSTTSWIAGAHDQPHGAWMEVPLTPFCNIQTDSSFLLSWLWPFLLYLCDCMKTGSAWFQALCIRRSVFLFSVGGLSCWVTQSRRDLTGSCNASCDIIKSTKEVIRLVLFFFFFARLHTFTIFFYRTCWRVWSKGEGRTHLILQQIR